MDTTVLGGLVSVLNGHVEAMRGIRDAIQTSADRMAHCGDPMGDMWDEALDSVESALSAVECSRLNCTLAATTWSLDGGFCELHAPEATSGPDEDAAYEEAVGKQMRPTRCPHQCPCGAVLICGDPDKCVAGQHWQCPTCEQDVADAFWQQQQAMTAELTTTKDKR